MRKEIQLVLSGALTFVVAGSGVGQDRSVSYADLPTGTPTPSGLSLPESCIPIDYKESMNQGLIPNGEILWEVAPEKQCQAPIDLISMTGLTPDGMQFFQIYDNGKLIDSDFECPCENDICKEEEVGKLAQELGSPTPTNAVKITPELTPTNGHTETPEPSVTPTPKGQHCDNGVGNGPDCPPPGHDKNGDGIADTPKGNNDNDLGNLTCGEPGNPCNQNGRGNRGK